MCYQAIEDLLGYALRTGLIEECDRTWAANRLLQTLGLESWEPPQTVWERPLEDILKELLDDAAARGVSRRTDTAVTRNSAVSASRKVSVFDSFIRPPTVDSPHVFAYNKCRTFRRAQPVRLTHCYYNIDGEKIL